MITNFEEITEELTGTELKLIPILVEGFKHYDKSNPVKSHAVCTMLNNSKAKRIGIKVSGARLRKCVNYIRVKGLLPIIGTSKGYYVSNDKEEIEKQIKSLNERANSIRDCAKGLQKFIT